MKLRILARIAGMIALTSALAGCIDVTMDVEVQNETNGKATLTSTMGKDFYAMVKAGAASDKSDSSASTSEGFCDEEGAVLTENADGSADCVIVSEGTFADLKLGEDDNNAKFTVQSPGVVRVAFDTTDMASEVKSGEEQDEQTKAMMQAFFEGHFITIRIHGKKIGDTNMTVSPDGTAAEFKIPFLDLINGTANLPPELYAVVDTN